MTPASRRPAVCASAVMAGPVFVASSALAFLYLRLPQPVTVEVQEVVAFMVLLLPAMIVGFLPAFFLCLIGSACMIELTRNPAAWAGVGAAAGCVLAALFRLEPAFAFGLVATSLVCAWMCTIGIDVD